MGNFILPLVDGEQSAAEDLCKIGRIVQRERKHRRREAAHAQILADAGDERQAEIEEKELEHQRRAAHDEDIRLRDPFDRAEATVGTQRDQEAQRQRKRKHQRKEQQRRSGALHQRRENARNIAEIHAFSSLRRLLLPPPLFVI